MQTQSARRIVASLFSSLDGVVKAPEKWHFPYADEEMGAIVGGLMAGSDTLLLGRVTYEEFAATWPRQTGDMADALNAMPKLVASTTLTRPSWSNTTVIDGDVVAAVTALKEQPGKDISITGSITLTRTLLNAGLVDDLHLLVHPLVVGGGQRLFGDERLPLALAGSTTLATGVVYLHYRPA